MLSKSTKERLLHLLRILENHAASGVSGSVTSAQVEQLTGWSRETIRKDISSLISASGTIGNAGGAIGNAAGYEPQALIPLIKKALKLDHKRKFCIIGLGRLGSAYLNFSPVELDEFELAAGFDSNVNRVEILKSQAPLYPVYKMSQVISRLGIELALICVPADAAQTAAEKCVEAGIRGILNYAPVPLNLPPEVAVRNVFVVDDLRSLVIKLGEHYEKSV